MVIPEVTKTDYAVINVDILEPKELIEMAGIEPLLLQEDIERRIDILNGVGNTDLGATVFIDLPEYLMSQDEWNALFLKALNYK